ncbi:unnamed protein product [Durusdinium trenchii]|uniref:Uncharacterized protein n=1 Tax=Durusdinium trenchii TaxID=1381693 RepID=A0ABP0PYQ4_9DINO
MTQFRSCLRTHGFLLRLLAADKGLSCIKFFKAKNPGVLFIDETSELEVGAFLSLTATFPQAVCLLDSGQTMSKANSTKLQLDDEPTEVQTAELLKNTCRPESSGLPAWRQQILEAAQAQQVVELQTRLELRFSTSTGGLESSMSPRPGNPVNSAHVRGAQKEKSSSGARGIDDLTEGSVTMVKLSRLIALPLRL